MKSVLITNFSKVVVFTNLHKITLDFCVHMTQS